MDVKDMTVYNGVAQTYFQVSFSSIVGLIHLCAVLLYGEIMSKFPMIKANVMSIAMRKPVYGAGINDADYMVRVLINDKRVICKLYNIWTSMLARCYSKKFHNKYPTYKDCTVAEEWLLFSNFRKWMIKQDWEGKQLDKDILFLGNKHYSPETCMFITSQVNSLLSDCGSSRGFCLQGVHYSPMSMKYQAYIKMYGRKRHLGSFQTEEEAAKAYNKAKYAHIIEVAGTQADKIKKALTRIANIKFKENYLV